MSFQRAGYIDRRKAGSWTYREHRDPFGHITFTVEVEGRRFAQGHRIEGDARRYKLVLSRFACWLEGGVPGALHTKVVEGRGLARKEMLALLAQGAKGPR